MSSLSSWLRLYCLIKAIVEFNGYVLLAADADDFRNIAKQVVPEPLANKLARLASDISVKHNTQDKSEESDYYYESEEEDYDEDAKDYSTSDNNVRDLDTTGNSVFVKEWKTRVNFDELVERVKDRLTKELSVKVKNKILNPHERNPTESGHKNLEQRKIHNDRIKSSVNEDVDYGSNNDQNSFKIEKTYGYNKSKNKRPSKEYQNINSNVKTKHMGQEQKLSPHKIIEHESESFENNKYINYGENVQNENDWRVTKNYETPNAYLISNSNGNKYLIKSKQPKVVNHEEDNNFFHLHNKAMTYGIGTNPQKWNGIMEFNEKYVHNNDFPKNTEKDNSEIRYDGSEPVEHNYDVVPKKFNTVQSKFAVTGNNEHWVRDEFDMLSKGKNDSYEDYVIPTEENKYASDETTTSNYQNNPRNVQQISFNDNKKSRIEVQYNNNLQKEKSVKNKWQHGDGDENSKIADDYGDINDKSQEVKAKTESLLYNYDDGPKTVKDDSSNNMQIVSGADRNPKTKAKGTMIPTREYFKMTSPNYYISLPTVVEKYDSNEPLPEKDREREVIKHIVNPQTSINKKIRLL